MAEHWVEASVALDVAGSSASLLRRLQTGQIATKAESLFVEDAPREGPIPKAFWEGGIYSELLEDWSAGDFSCVLESERWIALSVRFDFQGILEILPFEQRALVARNLSVAGNPSWISARAARRFAYESCSVSVQGADRYILEQARLGFLAGRAVLSQCAYPGRDGEWLWEVREWNVPASFWEAMTWESPADWELGKFTVQPRSLAGGRRVTVTSVHFTADSVRRLVPSEEVGSKDAAPEPNLAKPFLPVAKLNEWWAKKASVKEALSEEDLLTLARAAYPDHSVSRERIRELRGPTKRGPKTVSR